MTSSDRKAACVISLSACFLIGSVASPIGAQADLLSGPKVEESEQGGSNSSGDSLVEMGFDGEMQRLDTLPEIAALDLLELSVEQRSAVDGVLTDRAAVTDRIVADHYATLDKMRGVITQARDQRGQDEGLSRAERRAQRAERMQIVRDTVEALQPLIERGPLRDEVSAALPEDQRDRYAEILDEYREALLEQRGGDGQMEQPRERPRRRGGANSPFGDLDREAFGDLMREMGHATRRVIDDLKSRQDSFLELIEPTPEQRSAIEVIFAETPPEDVDRQTFRQQQFRRVLELLTPEQRAKLAESRRG